MERLENELCYDYNYELCSCSNLSVTSPMSQLILQPFHRFTYITAHSPTLPLLHLHHSSFSNPSFASPTSQALHLIHLASRPCFLELCSFFNLSLTSPMSQLILQPFHRFTYVIAHSPALPLLHLRHSSFSNPSFDSPTSQALHLNHLASHPCFLEVCSFFNLSVASSTSQLVLQPFRCFTYITVHSPTLLSLLLRHKLHLNHLASCPWCNVRSLYRTGAVTSIVQELAKYPAYFTKILKLIHIKQLYYQLYCMVVKLGLSP